MGAAVEIDARDLKGLMARIDAAEKAVGAVETWESIAAAGESLTVERIRSSPSGAGAAAGIGPHGETWPAWADSYRRRKVRRGELHHTMLHNSGDLRVAISSAGKPGLAVWGADASVKYAAVHQYGHEFSDGRRVPARPFVGFGPAERAAATARLVALFEGAFEAQ